jgi:hypothetical protein
MIFVGITNPFSISLALFEISQLNNFPNLLLLAYPRKSIIALDLSFFFK